MQIARLIGGAGTGKTTELLRIMESALEHIKEPTLLGFASFTRAARAEAVGRASSAWNVAPEVLSKHGWFRTVHSAVLRCLGGDAKDLITESEKDLHWLSGVFGVNLSTSVDDELGRTQFIGEPSVASAMNCWSLARTTFQPLESVVKRMRTIDDSVADYARCVQLIEKYESAKRVEGKMDFDDMLLMFAGIRCSPTSGTYETTPIGEIPGVHAWLFDEQQDASPLLDAACRRLVSAPTVKWAYVVGDPFQAIYGFAGSSASCFMSWKADKERIMPKSYRCPRKILELGELCLKNTKGYFDRGIAPADHEGFVYDTGSIDDVVELVDPSQDWLLIARTNYQAARLAASLHSFGKPHKWTTQPEGVTHRSLGLKGLFELEHGRPVTGEQWKHAMELLPQRDKHGVAFITRGTKSKWKDPEVAKQWDRIWPEELEQVGATQALIAKLKSASWVELVDKGTKWRETARRFGVDLACEPRVRVGTIHSVKGAEADNVAMLTTTSKKVDSGMEDQNQRDEECRIAYVGVTRAKKHLHIIREGRPGTPRMEMP